jgi:hypothetical protein
MAIKFLKKKKADSRNLLMDHLHNAMYSQEVPRSQKQLHASHVTKQFCPREQHIIERDKVKLKSSPINPALRYTFDEGKDKQKRFNNDWMYDYHVGNWRCSICAAMSYGKALQPDDAVDDMCHEGGGHEWEYEEVVFKDPQSGIIGSIDAILDLAPPKPFTVVEVKIMKGDDFRDLQAPLAEHTLRTKLYLYLIANDTKNQLRKQIDLSKAHVLYMARGYGYKHIDHGISPFKDFVVERDDKAVIPYVNRAMALQLARKSKAAPMRLCESMNCPRANSCPVKKQCFSQPEGTISWWDGKKTHKGADMIADVGAAIE